MNLDNDISSDATIINSDIGNHVKVYKSAEIKHSQLGNYVSVGDQTRILKSQLSSNIAINRRNFIQQSNIGRFTYTGLNTVIRTVEIGSFCSISWNVSIGGKNHNYHNVTTSSIWRFYNMDGRKMDELNNKFVYGEDQESCVIGNDVWISANAVILRGVKIGDGAIIGAGAVVTKNIEPYSIVAGVPAKEINKRFDEKTVEALEKIQWWNWPKDVIRNNLELIYSTTVDEYTIEKLFNISENIK